jgi:PKD repeat protein
MKKLLLLLGITLFTFSANAQSSVVLGTSEYDQMKAAGTLPGKIIQPSIAPVTPSNDPDMGLRAIPDSCACYVEPDGSYTLALGPVDDGSTASLPIPFNFCFYGQQQTSLYVNNNGNVSFGSPFASFSSIPLPSTTFDMIAPFWADIDTRLIGGLPNGEVWYKITPTAIYINWVDCGYFSMHDDKKVTFQLILTNGLDSVVPNGRNVAFCYKNMDWTTGDASSGMQGFGGVPATVGVNQGNGLDYFQIGRFNQAGVAYDGSYGNTDEVDWLDDQSIFFDVCPTNNVPPIAIGICPDDTFTVCSIGDTMVLHAMFLAPEIGQINTLSITAPGVSGFTPVNIINANTASGGAQVVASNLNLGYNTITFTATDDGVPVLSTSVSVTVLVDTAAGSGLQLGITGPASLCSGDMETLTATTGFDSYLWSNLSQNQSTDISSSGSYSVTASDNGCFATATHVVTSYVTDTATSQVGTLLSANLGGATYQWIDCTTGIPLLGETNQDYTVTGAGGYAVIVTDSNCTETSACITIGDPLNASFNNNTASFCDSGTVAFTDNSLNVPTSWEWSFPGGTPSSSTLQNPAILYSTVGVYDVSLIVSNNTYTDTITQLNLITITEAPTAVAGSDVTSTYVPSSGIVNFTNAGSTGVNSFWDFGDGNTSTQTAPTHNYTAVGNYVVILTETNLPACESTDTLWIAVYADAINALFTHDGTPICPGSSVDFFDASLNGPTAWNWSFQGGIPATSTLQNPTITYNAGGLFDVTLVASNGSYTDSITLLGGVHVVEPAGALALSDVTVTFLSQGGTVNFFSSGTPGSNSSWDFGDGSTSTQLEPTHSYSSTGNYLVTLIETDSFSCEATDTLWITVYDSITGTQDIDLNSDLSIYPNPSSGTINLALHNWENESVNMTLTDVQGRLITELNIPNVKDDQQVTMSFEDEAAGIYLLHVESEQTYKTFKIVKR